MSDVVNKRIEFEYEEIENPLTPINPLLIRVREPSQFLHSQNFFVEIAGQELYKWSKVEGRHPFLFEALQESLRQVGYGLDESGKTRIQNFLNTKIHRFSKWVLAVKNWKSREERKNKWLEIELLEREIIKTPRDVVIENKILQECNGEILAELYATMEEAALLKERCALSEKSDSVTHHGKDFHEVSRKQQQRNMSQICARAKRALWFAETFGLMPTRLIMKDKLDNELEVQLQEKEIEHQENLPEENRNRSDDNEEEEVGSPRRNHAGPGVNKKVRGYEALDTEEKEQIRTVAYVMDRFSISLQAYHELTQAKGGEGLPRSYLIEGCTQALDAQVELSKTPGNHPGAELPFKKLLEKEIQRYIKKNNLKENPAQDQEHQEISIKVKIAGDGAQMARSCSLFIFSFSILDDIKQCLSSAGSHAVAVIKASEDYALLQEALSNITTDVNDLVEQGSIEVDGLKVNLEFFLGGDYKFLLIAMGMQAANSAHSCMWCKISQEQRCDLWLARDFMKTDSMIRSLGSDWKSQPGCRGQPLFRIPLDHVIFDELHMFLRIMDRLEFGIMHEMIHWDQYEAFTNNRPNDERHLKNLVKVIRTCGVSISVWKGKDNKYDWTSLMGNDKKKLLRQLPQHFPQVLKPETCETVTKLWKDFKSLFDIFTSERPTDAQIEEFHPMALQWARHLVSMNRLAGYQQTRQITPYIHILVYHASDVLEKYRTLKMFSGQGVEKKNDDFRRYFMRKSNRWDACASLLRIEKRQETLSENRRNARNYRKVNKEFWTGGGKEKVAAQVPRPCIGRDAPPEELGSENQLNNQQPSAGMDNKSLKRKTKSDLISILQEISDSPLNKKLKKQEIIDKILASST